MRTTDRDAATVPGGAPTILLGNRDLGRLRGVVERHAAGPEHEVAARLDAELQHAIVVPQAQVPPEVVAMGSRVSFEDLRTARCVEVELAWPEEADAERGRLSVLSPVGLALLGATAWETVQCEPAEGRVEELRIVSVAPGRSR